MIFVFIVSSLWKPCGSTLSGLIFTAFSRWENGMDDHFSFVWSESKWIVVVHPQRCFRSHATVSSVTVRGLVDTAMFHKERWIFFLLKIYCKYGILYTVEKPSFAWMELALSLIPYSRKLVHQAHSLLSSHWQVLDVPNWFQSSYEVRDAPRLIIYLAVVGDRFQKLFLCSPLPKNGTWWRELSSVISFVNPETEESLPEIVFSDFEWGEDSKVEDDCVSWFREEDEAWFSNEWMSVFNPFLYWSM